MGSLASSGERSRLPLRCQRRGHLLRHLRPAEQPRHRLRRHLARHAGLRRPFHRHLVETRRIAPPWPCFQVAGSGGLRWQQRLQFLGVEDRNPGSVVQPVRHHSYHRSLSHRCFQMESHRASSVLRDLQTLGRRASGQLRKVLNFIRNTSTKTGLVCPPISTETSIQPISSPTQSPSAAFASNDIRPCPPGTIRLLQCESIVA